MMQALMHGDLQKAFGYNPLFMCALPLVMLGAFRLLFPHIAQKHPQATGKALFSDKALLFYLVICFLWGILRNIENFT